MMQRCRLSSFGHKIIFFFFYEAINIALEASNRDSATLGNFKLEYIHRIEVSLSKRTRNITLPLFSFAFNSPHPSM